MTAILRELLAALASVIPRPPASLALIVCRFHAALRATDSPTGGGPAGPAPDNPGGAMPPQGRPLLETAPPPEEPHDLPHAEIYGPQLPSCPRPGAPRERRGRPERRPLCPAAAPFVL